MTCRSKKSGHEIFEPETKELTQEFLAALKGNKEIAFGGKHKNSQREMLAASAMKVCVEKQHHRLLLLPDRKHKKSRENYLRKENLPEAAVLLE